MTKRKNKQENSKGFLEGDLSGPTVIPEQNLDSIIIDNPSGTPEKFTVENLNALIEIYKLLNSPDTENRLRISYDKNKKGLETATVFIDGQQHYFTDSVKEIENFRTWSENNQKRKNLKNTSSN